MTRIQSDFARETKPRRVDRAASTDHVALQDSAQPAVAASAAVAPEHDPHLAHHYNTPQQQYDAAKFGMWLFLATELLLFGGLFCLYGVFRGNHPELFEWGAGYLNTNLGAINTIVLILSSMTMAFAVRYAQLGRRRALLAMLAATLIGGLTFMGIKYVEYASKFEHNLVWGVAFYDPPGSHSESSAAAADDGAETFAPIADAGAETDAAAGDLERGRALWMNTCVACHGERGEGVKGQAFDVRSSEFIADKTDKELIAFIKQGRPSFDPNNQTGIQMPPKGGNPLLKDADLEHIVAYIRTFQPPSDTAPSADTAGGGGADQVDGDNVADAADAAPGTEFAQKISMFIPKSSIPDATAAEAGLAADWEARGWGRSAGADADTAGHDDPLHDAERPANAHLFFGIYFLMTGLHGLHVMAGMVVIAVITIFAWRGRYGPRYFTPVEITGLYWHLVDLIWIFLFPLLYLIH